MALSAMEGEYEPRKVNLGPRGRVLQGWSGVVGCSSACETSKPCPNGGVKVLWIPSNSVQHF